MSHAHMDHFMGFDQLLRLFLARDATLRLFGPRGHRRLRRRASSRATPGTSPTSTPSRVDVTEIDAAAMQTLALRRARRASRARPLGSRAVHRRRASQDSGADRRGGPARPQDRHPGYAVTERTHLNVRPDALAAAGLRPGPWLNALKNAVRAAPTDDSPSRWRPATADRCARCATTLLIVTPGQKIAYVVDTLFSPANAAPDRPARRGAPTSSSASSPFLDADLDQATKRYHLTARQAGALARAAGAKRLQVFHFSPRYEGRYGELVAEAQAEFAGREMHYGELDGRGAALS